MDTVASRDPELFRLCQESRAKVIRSRYALRAARLSEHHTSRAIDQQTQLAGQWWQELVELRGRLREGL